MSSSDLMFSPLFSRHHPGGVYTIAGVDEVPGDAWFVDSAATNAGVTTGHGTNPHTPFATLAYAFSSDLVSSGDTVYIMPSHAETIAAAGGITMDIAGVRVVGLGKGATRPTFSFSTALSTWLITAASTTVENIICTVSAAVDVTAGITVTAADCTLKNIEVRESGATLQFVNFLVIHTGGARTTVNGFVFSGAAGDIGNAAILISAVVDQVRIENVWIVGTLIAGGISSTAANTNLLLRDIYVENKLAGTDTCIGLNAGTTGTADRVRVRSQQNDADGFNLAIVGAAMSWFDPLVVNLAGERGGAWGTPSAAA